MNIISILKWIFRIFIVALILILIMDNLQIVRVNILGMYSIQMRLIVVMFVFIGLGILIGLLIGFVNNIKLKSRIHQLETLVTTPKHSKDE